LNSNKRLAIPYKIVSLNGWLKEPILRYFYIYLILNLFFAFQEIAKGTLLGQCYLNMDFKCYLFQFAFRSHWFRESLIGLGILIFVEYLFNRSFHKNLPIIPKKWKNNLFNTWFKWVMPFFLIIQVYFTLKLYGSIYNHHIPLWEWEGSFWSLVHPIFASLPTWTYKFLDIVYVPVWGFAHWLFLFALMSSNEKFKRRLFGVYGLSLMIFGILHCLLPAVSPIYIAKDYFNYLPDKLFSWNYHNHCFQQESLFLTKGVEAFTLLKGKAITPIAAFPSFHVGYALLLLLMAREFCSKWLVLVSFLFLFLTILGSLVLGFHYVADDVIGIIVVYPIYIFIRNTEGGNTKGR